VLGSVSTYILGRDGAILGRIEYGDKGNNCYARGAVKGGSWIGSRLTHHEFLDRVGA
jgi:hypothetical protein